MRNKEVELCTGASLIRPLRLCLKCSHAGTKIYYPKNSLVFLNLLYFASFRLPVRLNNSN